MNWPLSSDNFTLWDRLKVCSFVLGGEQLTMGPKTAEFERQMSKLTGCHALAVSSGSAANQLIFELWKQKNPRKFKNSLIIAPAVSWISTISPAIMSGYNVEFCDINLKDLSFDYNKLEFLLKKHKDKNCIIWPTSLISRCPDFDILSELAEQYNAELFGDFCEDLFSKWRGESIFKQTKMSSVSCYFSHCITSIEFGFVLFKDKEDYDWGKMFRNHGLTRSLSQNNNFRIKIENTHKNIDPQFLFGVLGTNMRPTDMHAVWGLQDFKRIEKYKKHRQFIYNDLVSKLDGDKYQILPYLGNHVEHYPFCLPFIRKDDKIEEVKKELNNNGIATRPIIGGCLTLQPALKKYHRKNAFPNALWLHKHGAYCGLNFNLTSKDIDNLVNILNNI